MDEDRRARYRDKLALIDERGQDVRNWASGASVESLAGDKKTRLAVYKALQELVEAAMDICAMRVVDLGVPPKDDYANIAILQDRSLLSANVAGLLREANGLRNRLVHTYNHIEDRRVLDFMETRLDSFRSFVDLVNQWLN